MVHLTAEQKQCLCILCQTKIMQPLKKINELLFEVRNANKVSQVVPSVLMSYIHM